ncbi:MAG: phenylalanine--tRNA ligase subunit beta [Patescibacteria group bacterium]
MKVPLNWLKDYVDIEISTDDLLNKLTAIGHMQDKKPETIAGDTVLDLEVRQNRSDCLSIMGVAQEVAAVEGRKIKKPINKEIEKIINNTQLKIVNEAPEACYRFSAFKLVGIDPKVTTPKWMKDRLEAYGMKSISPVVDVTNFVMIETGEPMHAFDSRSVPQGVIKIRMAKKGEKLTVLGEKTIDLTTDDLIVVDHNDNPISFSGLIGGNNSGIKDDSTEIILEAATYNQAVIRRSSIRHSIRTEASTRHEKFLHTELVMPALVRATSLILEICGGKINAFDESYAKKEKMLELELKLSEIKRLGGVDIKIVEATKIFENLGFEIIRKNESGLVVKVPIQRTDILESADLVEEVLRIYGYENIKSSLPEFAPPKNITSKHFEAEEKIKDLLLSIGFSETLTEPLVDKDDVNLNLAIPLQNALNADKSYLRTTMKQGLLHAHDYQKKHLQDNQKIFEIGKVYSIAKDEVNPYKETRMVGILVSDESKNINELQSYLAGVIIRIGQYVTTKNDLAITSVNEHTVFAEIDIDDLKENIGEKQYFFDNIPHFSSIDISIEITKDANVDQIAKVMSQEIMNLYELKFEVNTELAPEGFQYVLFKITMYDIEDSKEVILSKLTSLLTQKYQATIR